MSKLEERESRRRSSVIGSMVDNSVNMVGGSKKGRPKKEGCELKKRISLSVLPSLYEDIQKIAYVQRRSVSELVAAMMEEYRENHMVDLVEYQNLKNVRKQS